MQMQIRTPRRCWMCQQKKTSRLSCRRQTLGLPPPRLPSLGTKACIAAPQVLGPSLHHVDGQALVHMIRFSCLGLLDVTDNMVTGCGCTECTQVPAVHQAQACKPCSCSSTADLPDVLTIILDQNQMLLLLNMAEPSCLKPGSKSKLRSNQMVHALQC